MRRRLRFSVLIFGRAPYSREPKRLSVALPGRQKKMHRGMMPTPVKPSSIHQPLKSMSCRRRTPTASIGRKSASRTKPMLSSAAFVPSKCCKTAWTTRPRRVPNKENHQYSARVARPRKVAYFLKQRMMDSLKPGMGGFRGMIFALFMVILLHGSRRPLYVADNVLVRHGSLLPDKPTDG